MVGKIQILIIECCGASFPSFLALKYLFYSKTQLYAKRFISSKIFYISDIKYRANIFNIEHLNFTDYISTWAFEVYLQKKNII